MYKMINGIQHYAWGSYDALTKLYGIENPTHQPMAELWMGAHSLCSSKIEIDNKQIKLRDLIAQHPEKYLGTLINNRFGELPFLFKVLCAAQPLSIQVHPSKTAAEQGYQRENQAGIALTDAKRNYKDPNHKPELVFALTSYQAMNGFRPFTDIAQLLKLVRTAHPLIDQFIAQPDSQLLAKLFGLLLGLQDQEKHHALQVLKQVSQQQSQQPWSTINNIATIYPDDMGLFAPLLLNVVQLQPGEAMFLYAETPHAYLQGVGLEVMANSDNVLRAGLTPKYIDIPELIANVDFTAKPVDTLLMQPEQRGNETYYPIPVADFAFSLHQLTNIPELLSQTSASILLCLSGEVTIEKQGQAITLIPGESCFTGADENPIFISGNGQLARVSNQIDS